VSIWRKITNKVAQLRFGQSIKGKKDRIELLIISKITD
ncbi:unnamed protein product, partial [Acidithrix sp. C25]